MRGAEVTQVVDDEGHIFTGESENDQQLRGTTRKLELLLVRSKPELDCATVHASLLEKALPSALRTALRARSICVAVKPSVGRC